MAGGQIQRMQPGVSTAISASTWNRFGDAALAIEQLRGTPRASDLLAPPRAEFLQLTNETGADRSPRQIVGFDEHAIDWPEDTTTLPEVGIPVGKAIAPKENERFAVLRDFVEQGSENAVYAQRTGLAYVLVDIKDVDDTVCGPVDDQYTHLESGTGTTPILDKATVSTGVQWCVILVGAEAAASIASRFAVSKTALLRGGVTWSGSSFEFTPGSVGEAYLLEWVWDDDHWVLKIVDAVNPIECVCGYAEIDIPAGKLVRIDFTGILNPGYEVGETLEPPVATLVEDNEYRRQLFGYNGSVVQVLYHDASGIQRWGGSAC